MSAPPPTAPLGIEDRALQRLFQRALHAYSDEQAVLRTRRREQECARERQEQERLQALLQEALDLEVPISQMRRMYQKWTPRDMGWTGGDYAYVPRDSLVAFTMERHKSDGLESWMLVAYAEDRRGNVHRRVLSPAGASTSLALLGGLLSDAGINPFTYRHY